ncbi:Transmembrane protein 55A [Homalodisca vitripennis]|nr:Transmembrane protein 55A [Homalodisca vitripennis]
MEHTCGGGQAATVSPIGPDELPPPYQAALQGGPMVTCRVCQAMIDVSGKKDQHVVKCNTCNEATVSDRVVNVCNSYKSADCSVTFTSLKLTKPRIGTEVFLNKTVTNT